MTSTLQLPLLAIPQQPSRGFDVTHPMDRETFERLVQRARAILETCPPEVAWDELKDLGLKLHGFGMHTFRDDAVIWEHPRMTEHNDACGQKHILSQGFYTLYADVVEYESRGGHVVGYLQFVRGRVGNTVDLALEVEIVERDCQPCDRCGAWSDAYEVREHGTDETGYRDYEIVCAQCGAKEGQI